MSLVGDNLYMAVNALGCFVNDQQADVFDFSLMEEQAYLVHNRRISLLDR